MPKKAIPIQRRNLIGTGLGCTVAALIWLLLAGTALRIGGLSQVIILPISVILAVACGCCGFLAFRRATNEEPALIIDEHGIFDNISLARTGRSKWVETSSVWLTGPSWFRQLCILPGDVNQFIENQEEGVAWLMKLQQALFGAPIVIPLHVVYMPPEDIWHRVMEIAGPKASAGDPNGAIAPDL